MQYTASPPNNNNYHRNSMSSTWKRALHAPLRLDIYYEHDTCFDEGGESSSVGIAAHQQQPPQRELLERWCIDYVPSSTSNTNSYLLHSSPSSSSSTSPYSSRIMTGTTVSNNDTKSSISGTSNISQWIVVLLRSLHCMTRMLPASRLGCAGDEPSQAADRSLI